MASAGIKLKLVGFEDLLKSIQEAEGDLNKSVESAMRQSAQIMQNTLKNEMRNSGVDNGLIQRIPPPEIQVSGNTTKARVGYHKGNFDAKNISDGYKVVFLNYGTPTRSKHGQIDKMDFIKRAKKVANPKIKKAQKEVFEKILQRLKK